MKFYTSKEAANQWGVSEQLVRRYCREKRVEGAVFQDDCWLIPEDTEKPGPLTRKEREREEELPRLLKRILYQKARNNHYGIYEYLQVNLAYSSSRMASNRLTRQQVLDIYRTGKLCRNFEETKIDDIIEILCHFEAASQMLDTVMEPLTQSYVKKLHYRLTYGTMADRRHKLSIGTYRRLPAKLPKVQTTAPDAIPKALGALIKDYEREPATLERILDFHVKFERIHPFADYNGRTGRLLMVKECLRYGIDPFILDDKRRGEYHRGLASWEADPAMLTETVLAAQKRFQEKMETCRLMEYCRDLGY